jgi:hypothetical protein
LLERLSESQSTMEKDVLIQLVDGLLWLADGSEWMPSLVAVSSKRLIKKNEVTGTGIAFTAGQVALDTHDRDGFASILRVLRETVIEGEKTRLHVLDAASRLAAESIWKDYFQSHPTWEWYWEMAPKDDDTEPLTVLGAIRVGAVALMAGNISLAIRVANDLRDFVATAGLEEWVSHPVVTAKEQVVSEMHGRFLGNDAEVSLREFARFAAAITADGEVEVLSGPNA